MLDSMIYSTATKFRIYYKSVLIASLILLGEVTFDISSPNASQGQVAFSPNDIVIILTFCLLLLLFFQKKYIPSTYARRIFLVMASCVAVLSLVVFFHIVRGRSFFEFAGQLRNCYASTVILFVIDYFASAKKTAEELEKLKRQIEYGLIFVASFYFLRGFSYLITQSLLTDEEFITNQSITSLLSCFLLVSTLYWRIIYQRLPSRLLKAFLLVQIILFYPVIMVGGNRLGILFSLLIPCLMFLLHFRKHKRWLYRVPLFALSISIVMLCYLPLPRNVHTQITAAKSLATVFPSQLIEIVISAPSAFIKDAPEDLEKAKRVAQISEDFAQASDSLRTLYWKEAVSIIKEYPILGSGRRLVTVDIGSISNGSSEQRASLPHNFVLEIGCLLGGVGIMLYAIFGVSFTAPLLFGKVPDIKEKMDTLTQYMVFFGYAFLQPALTGGIYTNELFFCMVGLAYLRIVILKRSEAIT